MQEPTINITRPPGVAWGCPVQGLPGFPWSCLRLPGVWGCSSQKDRIKYGMTQSVNMTSMHLFQNHECVSSLSTDLRYMSRLSVLRSLMCQNIIRADIINESEYYSCCDHWWSQLRCCQRANCLRFELRRCIEWGLSHTDWHHQNYFFWISKPQNQQLDLKFQSPNCVKFTSPPKLKPFVHKMQFICQYTEWSKSLLEMISPNFAKSQQMHT